jgi:hypothetical protein
VQPIVSAVGATFVQAFLQWLQAADTAGTAPWLTRRSPEFVGFDPVRPLALYSP